MKAPYNFLKKLGEDLVFVFFILAIILAFGLWLKLMQPALTMLAWGYILFYIIPTAFISGQSKNGWLSVAGIIMYLASWPIARHSGLWIGAGICLSGILIGFYGVINTCATFILRLRN